MSTTRHQVVGKRKSSEACELTGENILGRETRFLSSKVVSRVAEVVSLFPRLQASIC